MNFVFEEKSVKSITSDKNLVVKALGKCQHILSANHQYAKLKYASTKNKIVVKAIETADEASFTELI